MFIKEGQKTNPPFIKEMFKKAGVIYKDNSWGGPR